jgi:hypothetical protein
MIFWEIEDESLGLEGLERGRKTGNAIISRLLRGVKPKECVFRWDLVTETGEVEKGLFCGERGVGRVRVDERGFIDEDKGNDCW